MHLDIVLARNRALLVDLESFRPLLELLIPVFFVLDEKVLLGIVQNAFSRFRLLKLVIRLNKLLDSVSR